MTYLTASLGLLLYSAIVWALWSTMRKVYAIELELKEIRPRSDKKKEPGPA